MTATDDGAELLRLTKRQKLCTVSSPPMRALNNPECSVAYVQHLVKVNKFCEGAMPCKYLMSILLPKKNPCFVTELFLSGSHCED